jgi:hypothetical protein
MSKDFDNIICGDFNIDALKPENTDVKMTFAELGLGPLFDQATRTTFKSATLLDQIYCSNRKLSFRLHTGDRYIRPLYSLPFSRQNFQISGKNSNQNCTNA